MSENQHEIANVIEELIRERFEVRPSDAVFSRKVNLWEEGYLDSLGVVEVISFLESTFGVRIPEEVLFSPDFTHIDGMAGWLVELRRRQATFPQDHA